MASSRFVLSERTFRESANHERRKIEEDRSREGFEYNEKLKNIEAKHQDEIALLKEVKEQDLKVEVPGPPIATVVSAFSLLYKLSHSVS
jgi:hypothetical protein